MPYLEKHYGTGQLRAVWRKGYASALAGIRRLENPYVANCRKQNGATFGESYRNAWAAGWECGQLALRQGEALPTPLPDPGPTTSTRPARHEPAAAAVAAGGQRWLWGHAPHNPAR